MSYSNSSNVTRNNRTGHTGWDGELFCKDWCFAVGLMVTVTSSSFHTAGALLQKVAHQHHEQALLRGEEPRKCGFIPLNPLWVLGLLCLVVVPSPLDTLAFSLAGESLVIPVGMGCNVLLSQFLSPLFTGEYPGRKEFIAAAFVVIGCSLTSIFGTHHTPHYTYKELLGLSGAVPFVVTLVFCVILQTTCLFLYTKDPAFAKPYRIVIVAFIPALFGAATFLSLKTVGELIKQAIAGYSYWDTFPPYLFLVFLVCSCVPQISYMNAGCVFFFFFFFSFPCWLDED